MSSEIAGAVASVRLLWDVVTANKQLAENRELVTAVSKVNADLMAAQAVALDAQKEQAALAQRVRELEQKIMTLENWDREAERYQLTDIAPKVPAYTLKPGIEQSEQAHHLCANCFADHKKSFLQLGPAGQWKCSRCKGEWFFPRSANVRVVRS